MILMITIAIGFMMRGWCDDGGDVSNHGWHYLGLLFCSNRRNLMRWYTPQEIREMYDTNPNTTLKQLAKITGRDIRSLKHLLMSGDESKAVAAYVSEGLGE
jgi:hypothetical protein